MRLSEETLQKMSRSLEPPLTVEALLDYGSNQPTLFEDLYEARAYVAELREILTLFYFPKSEAHATLKDGSLLTPLGRMRPEDFEKAEKVLRETEKYASK